MKRTSFPHRFGIQGILNLINHPPNAKPKNHMKTNRLKNSVLAASAALALVSLAGINNASADLYYDTFDTSAVPPMPDGTGAGLAATSSNIWDGAVNGPNEPNSPSGSMYVTVPFTTAGGWQELQLNFTTAGDFNMNPYLNVEFDLKVDVANSHAAADGTYGGIYPVLQNWDGTGTPGWGQLPAQVIAGTNGWQHFKFSTASFSGNITRLVMDINTGGSAVTNTVAYWIDDIVFTQPPLPAPTLLSPIPAPKHLGLQFLPAGGNQYQRVMVYPNPSTKGTAFGWYGTTPPVSYSFTITNFPLVGGYTAQIFWIPNYAMVYGPADTSVDWNCTNDLILTVSANSNASSWGVTMAAKTNSPGALGNGNPNLTITNFAWTNLPVGKWTVTFNNNTDFTITAPDNSTVSASLPADVANLVSGNSLSSTADTVYFGIQPNMPDGIGQPAVFSNIQIAGTTPNTINDSFNAGSLDTNTWTTLTDVPGDITVNNGDQVWWLRWNTPNDQGYATVQGASSITGPWQDLEPSSNWLLVNTNRYAFITASDLSNIGATSAAYFRLLKRTFTQLQVLWPGETNAPGTVSGYTGTAAPESVATGYNGLGYTPVTVNACDPTWHIVNSSDTVALANTGTSDPTDILPSATALSHGTAQLNLIFNSQGSWTIDAVDNSNTNIPPATSTTVTVGP